MILEVIKNPRIGLSIYHVFSPKFHPHSVIFKPNAPSIQPLFASAMQVFLPILILPYRSASAVH